MLEAIFLLAAVAAVNIVFEIIKRSSERPARTGEWSPQPVDEKKVG